MNTVYEETKKTLMHGVDAVVVEIIKTEGSSPGKTGAKMLVRDNGKTAGTIGGGDLEKYCTDLAVDVYKTKKTYTREFKLDSSKQDDVAMICGGDVTVRFNFIDYQHTDPNQLNDFFGISIPTPKAYIFGGGHVGHALCPVLTTIGFDVTVLDDREEFASKTMHPSAKTTIVCDYKDIGASVKILPDDYVVIMTHGHSGDRDVLLQACKTGATYIGCIGSRKKVEMTRQFLKDNKIEQSIIDSVHQPIGLPIGGQSPEEIAISVAAEIIQHRYNS